MKAVPTLKRQRTRPTNNWQGDEPPCAAARSLSLQQIEKRRDFQLAKLRVRGESIPP